MEAHNPKSTKRKKTRSSKTRARSRMVTAIVIFSVLMILAGIGLFVFLYGGTHQDGVPSYVQKMYLTRNPYSRPAEKLPEVKSIVIHYVANPQTSAEANRNYFQNLSNKLSNPSGVKASSHFIVGLEGEVIQCIPLTEIAYANYPLNYETISIEVCHPDASGEFKPATYDSVIRLTADLLKKYGLTADDVIRHHDVSGKNCPKFYVEHEDAWEKMKADIAALLEE